MAFQRGTGGEGSGGERKPQVRGTCRKVAQWREKDDLPSISGIQRSVMARSKCWRRDCSTASLPLAAVTTTYPSACNIALSALRMAASSSITKTLACADEAAAIGLLPGSMATLSKTLMRLLRGG